MGGACTLTHPTKDEFEHIADLYKGCVAEEIYRILEEAKTKAKPLSQEEAQGHVVEHIGEHRMNSDGQEQDFGSLQIIAIEEANIEKNNCQGILDEIEQCITKMQSYRDELLFQFHQSSRAKKRLF